MLLEHKLIKYNFDTAAATYAANTDIQKITANKIDKYLMNNYHSSDLTLDLGSGPGTFTDKFSNTIRYDISLNMLKTGINENNKAVNGDAIALPFANASFDIIISNLMLQWVTDKSLVFAEIARVLRDDGLFVCTTLINKSLWQLKMAWSELDNHEHTIKFAHKHDYFSLATSLGLEIVYADDWEHTIYFDEISQLLMHFKLTGTSIPKSACNKGLGGRNNLANLDQVYKRVYGKLPLSYHNLLLVLKKKPIHATKID